jgi:hypothetical protein
MARGLGVDFPRIFSSSHWGGAMAGKDDNLSLVLNAIQDVSFQQRPIPKIRKVIQHESSQSDSLFLVGDHEILVEVKKTG